MAQPRDSQRAKVYRAEKAPLEKSIKYETVSEVEAFLATVIRHPWFKKEFPNVRRVRVTDGRRRRRACGDHDRWGQPFMKLPRGHRDQLTILHELAHGLQPDGTAWHGPEFCSIYVRLVYRFIGPEMFNDLTRSFRDNNVRYLWIDRFGV